MKFMFINHTVILFRSEADFIYKTYCDMDYLLKFMFTVARPINAKTFVKTCFILL